MKHTNEQIEKYIQDLIIIMGFKKYELDVHTAYGEYFISLPHDAYTFEAVSRLQSIFGSQAKIGNYSTISKNTLSIRTNIRL